MPENLLPRGRCRHSGVGDSEPSSQSEHRLGVISLAHSHTVPRRPRQLDMFSFTATLLQLLSCCQMQWCIAGCKQITTKISNILKLSKSGPFCYATCRALKPIGIHECKCYDLSRKIWMEADMGMAKWFGPKESSGFHFKNDETDIPFRYLYTIVPLRLSLSIPFDKA